MVHIVVQRRWGFVGPQSSLRRDLRAFAEIEVDYSDHSTIGMLEGTAGTTAERGTERRTTLGSVAAMVARFGTNFQTIYERKM